MTSSMVLLYHFIQLVSVVTRDRLDEILFSSFGSYSRDMQKFWEESDHKYIIFPPIRPLEKREKKEKKSTFKAISSFSLLPRDKRYV